MKIEHVETYVAESWMFVEITTDTGLVGVGESTFFGWPSAAAEIAVSFRDILVGEDPLRVEHLWLAMYRAMSMRGQAIVGAISAIDQALWDLKGKRFEAPVWELLGGRVRDGVRAMLVLPTGTLDEVVAHAEAAVTSGYGALKVLLFQDEHHGMRYARKLDDLVSRAAALREAIGWDIDLAFELHRNMTPGESVPLIRELERFRPLFVEDPIAPDSVLSFGEVASKVAVPMAAGERNTTIWEFREYIEHGGVAFVRPDVGVSGGITHLRKICAMAEAHHLGVVPHAVPSGPVATAAHVQLGACTPNWEVQEHREQDRPPWTGVVDSPVAVKDGYLVISDQPGLGITLDHDGLAQHPPTQRTFNIRRREDGSVAMR